TTETAQIGEEVVEVTVAQLRRLKGGHERSRLLRDLSQVGLQKAAESFACVHNLNGKRVLVLDNTGDALPFLCYERDGLVSGHQVLARSPDLACQQSASSRRSDSRQVRSQSAAARPDAMAAAASLLKNLLAIGSVA